MARRDTHAYAPHTTPAPVVREPVQATVGVRELRQNLSVYLERVKRGEALTVTEHGEEVAILRPMPRGSSVVERLVAEGRARPATRPLSDLPRPRRATPGSRSLERILDDLREERVR
jgi:prevent-host-death family protein